MLGDEALTVAFSKALLERGIFVSPIVFPTVPKGKARLRVMVSAAHTIEQLDHAVSVFRDVAQRLIP
jgi:glycine C-acetyltransferase